MKLGGTKAFCAVFIAFLIVALGSTAQTQKPQGCNDPPWSDPGGKCNLKQKAFINTASVGWPARKNRDCFLWIQLPACNFFLSRKTTVPLATKCPEAKDFAHPTFCCDEFKKAVKTKQPCDPMQDADCDGLPNDTDPDPLGPRDPDADHKCATLASDVYDAYLKAGASNASAFAASVADRDDCVKRRTDKNCGITDPPQTSFVPTFYQDPDSKCTQLGQVIYMIYLKAGANSETAIGAGQAALSDCLRRRASKM
ncbi:MAG: hypothetical protein M3R69_09920 [Acidobacteriota bacterium]|nr:hypothetical protein [Acidobacteriota bacterium]